MSFSQRQGIKPIKNIIQIDSMDDDLRNSLWNLLKIYYFNSIYGNISDIPSRYINLSNDDRIFLENIWISYFKKPLDEWNGYWGYTYKFLHDYFFDAEWYEVYDFVEFIANNYLNKNTNNVFIERCNNVFERELSGYRFCDRKITQITSEIEISEIEEALGNSITLKAVNEHLTRALELYSDRNNPDYRNSIKESISAIEAICKIITKKPNATLSQALDTIDTNINVHKALKDAFKKLYAFTSDEKGIRHSLIEGSNIDSEDAKFMLISCSAFTNYLIGKLLKAGIEISLI